MFTDAWSKGYTELRNFKFHLRTKQRRCFLGSIVPLSDVQVFATPFKLIEIQVRYLRRIQIEAIHMHNKIEA